jgi:BlaI family transcriptional regulator, penicillinase repressor
MRKLHTLSRREREIMDIVYGCGSAAASEVRARMADPPSYSAVRATMRILETKGFLKHNDDGTRYVYRPIVHRDKARASALDHLLATFFEGSPAGAVMALLEDRREQLSTTDLDRVATLIERARKEGR